jgi:hypothetical protein
MRRIVSNPTVLLNGWQRVELCVGPGNVHAGVSDNELLRAALWLL